MRILALAAIGLLAAQAQEPPAFEVVSIKLASAGPIQIKSDPGRLTATNVAADTLIRLAYHLREYQYQGPSWLHVTRYDILAATQSPQTRAVQLEMLRAVFADRFKLKIHRETRTMPVYALVPAKGGPKLHPMDDTLPAPFELYSNFSIAPTVGGESELRGFGSLGQLSDFLARVAERPVIDRTGIAGNFDLRLRCAIPGFPGEDSSISVFDALQTQLGLKLEGATSPIEIVIVDHVEKPSGN